MPTLPWYWRLLEAYFRRAYGIRPQDPSDPGCLIAYSLFTYRGPDVPLQCGTVVRSGDRVMELHFRREALMPLARDGDPRRVGLALARLGDRDVPRLAVALARDPELKEVRALHALTLFHRGITRYGFEVMPVREAWAERWFSWWHRLLMKRDHHSGADHVRKQQEKLVTRHIWISRDELLRRWGPPD